MPKKKKRDELGEDKLVIIMHCLEIYIQVKLFVETHSVRSVGGTQVKPTNASSGSSTLALKKAESADLPTDPMDSSENVELVVVFEKKNSKLGIFAFCLAPWPKTMKETLNFQSIS